MSPSLHLLIYISVCTNASSGLTIYFVKQFTLKNRLSWKLKFLDRIWSFWSFVFLCWTKHLNVKCSLFHIRSFLLISNCYWKWNTSGKIVPVESIKLRSLKINVLNNTANLTAWRCLKLQSFFKMTTATVAFLSDISAILGLQYLSYLTTFVDTTCPLSSNITINKIPMKYYKYW